MFYCFTKCFHSSQPRTKTQTLKYARITIQWVVTPPEENILNILKQYFPSFQVLARRENNLCRAHGRDQAPGVGVWTF